MLDWAMLPLKRYAEFEGRSRRMEYWSFALATTIIYLIFIGLMFAGGFSASSMGASGELGAIFWLGAGLLGIFALAILIPSIAVGVRRLHDRDMSGWWYLGFIVLGMIPYIGFIASIAFIVIMFLPGTPGPNRFGEDPKDPANTQVFE
ncbi:DUF805 domain-containing protein [Pontixanthobacter aquaemixtae]|uniref:DUF805 domain-containing protein n=1 Tax=Pontixanthobacter aquaemixtae TaxID=1958940 RepID=A0A844ZSG7_9SPHN|nr:DUF805 domain-containing protein [Pontixanthobacter aquaemixtae]MXO90795.1 DUF805 domain-containing protein [Pontixanthobacter aquaemixtae]